jgi:parallel beta-helix repeat protein
MSSEKHPNLQLHKWAPTDYVRREEWNENFGIIDDKIGILNKKVENVVSVKEFGAVGDGIVNDYTAIQNAINNSKVVFIPKGTYIVESPLTLKSDLKLIGEKGTIIKGKGFSSGSVSFLFDGTNYTNYPVLYGGNVQNIHIENIEIDGNSLEQTVNNVSCILIENSSNLSFENVITKNNKATSGASFVGGAFSLFNCTESLLKDCGVDSIDGEGVLLRSCKNITIRGGEYKNSTSSVIGTQYGSHIVIDSVVAHDTTNSVISLNSTDSKVVNSIVYNSQSYGGIILGHRSTYETRKPADNAVVANNHIYDCYAGGIIVQYGKNIIISNNQIINCNGAYLASDSNYMYGGINATYWCDSILITNNIVKNNNRGIYVAAGKSDQTNSEYTYGKFIITNNKVESNKLSGIQVNDNRFGTIIQSNIVQDNNIEQHSARAEISISFNFDLGLSDIGSIQIIDNVIGNITSGSGYQGIILNYTGTLGNLSFPILIERNHFYNMSSSNINNQLGINNVDIKNNYINGSFEQSRRTDISSTTSTLDIGYARFIRLTGSGSFNIDTITSKHSVGTEIVLQALNNPTLVESANLLLNGNFAMNTNDIIVLKWTGGSWLEISRSAN